MAKTAWGIEAGSSTVKAVKLTHDGKGGVTIDDVGMVPMASFRVEGGDESAALLGALSQLVLEKDIKPNESVFISLPGRNAFSRVITLPPVSEEAIRETIANEARGQIPIKLEEAVWDYQRISSEDDETQVNLYAVKRDVVDNLINTSRAAGLNVRGIQIAPLGIYNFIKYELDADISNSCVCIDIGGDNTDLLVVDGEKTWVRVVPTAGNDMTKALIMKDKRLKPEIAETLKRDPQRTIQKFNEKGRDKLWPNTAAVLEAVKAPMRELVGEIQRSVGYYKNQNDASDFNKLVIMGNGSKMLNIGKFLGQQLHYDVSQITELSSIRPGRGVDAAALQDQIPTLVVPIGLALQAVDAPGLATTNLIPLDILSEEQMAKVRPAALIGASLLLIAGIASFVMGNSEKTDASGVISYIETVDKEVRESNSTWNEQLTKAKSAQFRIEGLNNVMRGSNLARAVYTFTAVCARDWAQETESNFDTFVRPCDDPENQDEKERGIKVRETGHELVGVFDPEAEDAQEGGESGDFLLSYRSDVPDGVARYGRVTTVEMSLNYALSINEDSENRLKDGAVIDAVSDNLRVIMVNRLTAVLTPAADRDEAKAKIKLAFGDNVADSVLATMLHLRDELGPEASGDAASVRAKKIVGGIAGNLKKEDSLSHDQAFFANVGIELKDFKSIPKFQFYRVLIRSTFKGKPWSLPSDAKE